MTIPSVQLVVESFNRGENFKLIAGRLVSHKFFVDFWKAYSFARREVFVLWAKENFRDGMAAKRIQSRLA